ncbi:MAG TPA: MopE-related protein [Kofleriaceae bacterium]|nr:MopE-related protein [Kofleriaceae bacterium]
MRRVLFVLAAATLAACASADYRPPDAAVGDLDASVDDATGTDAAIDAHETDACVAAPERCNAIDDDCDGDTDEDFPTVGDACTVGVGACLRAGHFRCTSDGTGVECDAEPGNPGTESCNQVDDDCDGMTDEGYQVGVMCDGPDADLCAEGTFQCNAAGGVTCSDTTGDNVEVCNGLNDDCDGATDEGFDVGMMCDGPDADLCREGTIVCTAGGGTTCSDNTGNNVESCNNLDDDCDGNVDEGLNLGMPCDGADTDACVEGVIVCGAGGTTTCSDNTSSTVEICNGLDDDCTGGIDNGYQVNLPCTAGVGGCARNGTTMCNAAGNGVVCSAVPGQPTAETCGDGIDQDCSGADVSCPVNDRPTSPLDISNGGTFTVDLTAANNDQENGGLSCGLTGGRDVFYRFTLPAAEVVYFDTFGSSFDSVVRIFPGACTDNPGAQTCFDDQCSGRQTQGALQLAAGNYCLVVDQYSSAQTTGSLVLTFARTGRTGTAIAAASGTQSGTSCSGTNAMTGSCQPVSTAPDAGYYFLTCPSTTKTVAASTCSGTAHDSVVYLRKAGSGNDLACNDDTTGCGNGLQSSFTGGSAVGPGLFWLVVDGYQAECGPFTLTYAIN